MPLVALGVIGAVGAIGGGAIAASGASNAANAGANAANQAAQLQHQDAQASLAFQQQTYNQQQQNLAPWLTTGRAGEQTLASLMGLNVPNSVFSGAPTPGAGPGFNATGNNAPGNLSLQDLQGVNGGVRRGGPRMVDGDFSANVGGRLAPHNNVRLAPGDSSLTPAIATTTASAPTLPPGSSFGDLAKPWTEQFQAPTDVTQQNDPGYQFRLNEGQKALQASAAAKGNLFSGGTQKDLQSFAQDYASNEYGNVYNRALGQFQQRYNIFENNQSNIFNRYATMAGVGQTAANNLNSTGSQVAGNVANINLTSGAQIGANINNAGAARASGYAGGANAWGGAVGGIGSNLTGLYTLQQLLGKGSNGLGTQSSILNSDGSVPFINP